MSERKTLGEEMFDMMVQSGDMDRLRDELDVAYQMYSHAVVHMEEAMEVICKYQLELGNVLECGAQLSKWFDKLHMDVKDYFNKKDLPLLVREYNMAAELIEAAIENNDVWKEVQTIYREAKKRCKK